ncbi:hypothetical protein Sru01_26610 [Sphaerisporangium rufum]|uniref:Uncharacterized protein n=1 Tax=Sphaerisporangium rufum TaxID=1381558 RepID=A0A919R0T3_9ACTN|nr:hypothetical protein Sru01_26610 [Sphaerisporangium rufum]
MSFVRHARAAVPQTNPPFHHIGPFVPALCAPRAGSGGAAGERLADFGGLGGGVTARARGVFWREPAREGPAPGERLTDFGWAGRWGYGSGSQCFGANRPGKGPRRVSGLLVAGVLGGGVPA